VKKKLILQKSINTIKYIEMKKQKYQLKKKEVPRWSYKLIDKLEQQKEKKKMKKVIATKNKIEGKVHLTPSNYHSNDNLPPNYQLRQFTPQTTKAMTMYPQFLKNVEITLTKIKTKILKFNLIFKFEGYFCFIENFIGVISSFY
jgi:hypothetical protein